MAVADRVLPPGPRPREVWLTFGLAVLLHGVLVATFILMPRLQFGQYITVPVSYTVNLVDAPPGGQGGGSSPPPPAARPPAPPPPVVQPAPPRPAPPPPLAPRPAPRAEEELTLPSRRPPRERPQQAEPSLRPPDLRPRETARLPPQPPAPAAPPAPVPAAPAAPATPAAPPAVASVGNGAGGAEERVQLAGPKGGAGGGSALAGYLTLVDWKIQSNWTPLGAGQRPVVVRFRVLRSGQVRDIELETSSGDGNLDTAALRAIRQSIPLPPFSNLLTEPYLDLRYRFIAERG